MAARKVLLATILALLAGLTIVSAASAATSASVRAAALNPAFDVTTSVSVPNSGFVVDTFRSRSAYGFPNALAALGLAAHKAGYSFVTNGSDSATSTFVNSIAWIGGPPAWTSWWLYSVNGWSPDIGAGALRLVKGDRVTFYEVPGTAPVDTVSSYLVVRVEPALPEPGDTVTFTVVADDLTKPNSAASASRFKLDPGTVQASKDFPAVANATLHVGADTYTTDAQGEVAVPTTTPGAMAVWAEKPIEGSTYYVRSRTRLVNVDLAPELSGVSGNASFSRGAGRLTVHYTLSKAATVRLVVKNGAGKVAFSSSRAHPAGAGTTIWSGRNGSGAWVAAGTYNCTISAKDAWGRTSASVPLTVKVK